jgi:cell division septation protein DedD
MAAVFDAVEVVVVPADLHDRAGQGSPGTGAETMDQPVSRRRAVTALVAAALGAGLVWVLPGALPGAGAGPNPPGNNGTVKIDGVEFDTHPDNEPHVGCVFQVDFYGFDEGDLFADVTFDVWPPSGPMVTILEDTVDIGEDDNSGGGSEAGLDAQETYDLSGLLDGFEQHPQQGWHIKLTINADGSQGSDLKHKTFWVTDCEVPPPTTTTSTTAPTTSTTEEPTTSTTEAPTTSTTEEPTTSTTEAPTTSTSEAPTTSSTEDPYPTTTSGP